MWKAQYINENDIKKVQLVTTLHDIVLTWYLKYNTTHPATSLTNMKDVLNVEFMKPKSKSQCVTEIKKIKQKVNEYAWDIDQQLNCLLNQSNL